MRARDDLLRLVPQLPHGRPLLQRAHSDPCLDHLSSPCHSLSFSSFRLGTNPELKRPLRGPACADLPQWTIPDERRNYLISFPDKSCTAIGHIPQGVVPLPSPSDPSPAGAAAHCLWPPSAAGIVAIIAVPLWIFIGRIYTSCYLSSSPLSLELFGRADRCRAVLPLMRANSKAQPAADGRSEPFAD